MRFLLPLVWAVFGLLLLAGWLTVRGRLRRSLDDERVVLDDDAIERILADGVIEANGEEPLDLERIESEEQRFWEETWDRPEEL